MSIEEDGPCKDEKEKGRRHRGGVVIGIKSEVVLRNLNE